MGLKWMIPSSDFVVFRSTLFRWKVHGCITFIIFYQPSPDTRCLARSLSISLALSLSFIIPSPTINASEQPKQAHTTGGTQFNRILTVNDLNKTVRRCQIVSFSFGGKFIFAVNRLSKGYGFLPSRLHSKPLLAGLAYKKNLSKPVENVSPYIFCFTSKKKTHIHHLGIDPREIP